MKKRIFITFITCIIMLLSIIYAYGENIEFMKDETETVSSNQVEFDKEKSKKKIKEYLDANCFEELLVEQGYYIDEISDNMTKLIRISTMYDFTEKQYKEIYKLTEKGYNLGKILEIYLFTLDTTHPGDISYVKKIYDESKNIYTTENHWIAEAYNKLENNKNGILSEEEILEYLDNGFTAEEIYEVSALSRKGDCDIKDILLERQSGKEWNDIVSKVYKDEKISKGKMKNIKSLKKIREYIYYSEVCNEEIDNVVADDENLSENVMEKYRKKVQLSYDIANEYNLLIPDENEILELAKEKLPDVSEDTIKKYLKKGYLIRELEEVYIEALQLGYNFEEYME